MNSTIISIRKAFTFALFTVVLGSASLVSLAGEGDKGKGPSGNSSASTAEVKYISGKEGEFFFNVIYNNTSGSRFSVVVLDGEGYQLFQSLYSDKNFDKKFKLADPEGLGKLTFIIRNFGDNSVQRFEVNTNNRIVEDIEVKEVN